MLGYEIGTHSCLAYLAANDGYSDIFWHTFRPIDWPTLALGHHLRLVKAIWHVIWQGLCEFILACFGLAWAIFCGMFYSAPRLTYCLFWYRFLMHVEPLPTKAHGFQKLSISMCIFIYIYIKGVSCRLCKLGIGSPGSWYYIGLGSGGVHRVCGTQESGIWFGEVWARLDVMHQQGGGRAGGGGGLAKAKS